MSSLMLVLSIPMGDQRVYRFWEILITFWIQRGAMIKRVLIVAEMSVSYPVTIFVNVSDGNWSTLLLI